jgi:hypothetical protein
MEGLRVFALIRQTVAERRRGAHFVLRVCPIPLEVIGSRKKPTELFPCFDSLRRQVLFVHCLYSAEASLVGIRNQNGAPQLRAVDWADSSVVDARLDRPTFFVSAAVVAI